MKKNSVITLFTICFLSLNLNCQNVNFLWAKQMGGIGYDRGLSLSLDYYGNVYITGSFEVITDFDPGSGTYNLSAFGSKDIFVSKLDASGNFLWAKQMGGINNDEGWEISHDDYGNIYITGYFEGTADFDPGSGTYNLSAFGGADIFVSKLDASGNFLWAKQMGGTNNEMGFNISLDNNGNIYTTGYFEGTADFDPGPEVFNLSSAGGWDIFISKLDVSGNFIWAKRIGGLYSDAGFYFTFDNNDNIYMTGTFQDVVDFDPGPGIYNLSSAGGIDIFISKYDSFGNFIWAKQLGGSGVGDQGISIALDAYGNVYTTGFFNGIVDFDPGSGTYNLSSAGGWDIFISKLDVSGNFIWAKQIGGILDDQAWSIRLDINGNVYTTGCFSETVDFNPGSGTFNLTSNGLWDIFILKLDASGNFLWAQQMGGTNNEKGYLIAFDDNENVYTTGFFEGTADFDPSNETFDLTSFGWSDIFVSKLSQVDVAVIGLIGNLSFGNVQIGQSTQLTFSINNSGNANLLVSSISYPFSVYAGNWSGTIPPGGSQVITVTFTPTDFLTYNGNVTVNSNAANGNNTIPISGTGVGSIIGLSGNLSFGNVLIGTTAQIPFTINNSGNSDLTVNSIMYPFPVYTGNWSGTIPPGGSQEVTVTFTPTNATTYNGFVNVNSNAISGINTIPISGTGIYTPSQIVIKTYIPDNPSLDPNPKTLWDGNTGETPPTIKICADGSQATEIIFTNNTGINSDLIRFRVQSDPNELNPELYGKFINYNVSGNTINVNFSHPKYLPFANSTNRDDFIQIYESTIPNLSLYDIPIEIYRAPILFVHGFVGAATTFEDMAITLNNNNYVPLSLTKRIDYEWESINSLSSNVDEIQLGINDLFQQTRYGNFSTGKVDVVAHSLGGVLSRLYLQSNYGYTYREDVNKFITLNSPHSGSHLANYVVALLYTVCDVVEPTQLLLKFCQFWQNAGSDLKTNSYAVDNVLNSPSSLLQGQVPSHTISSYIENADIDNCIGPFTYHLLPLFPFMVPWIFGEGEQMDGAVRLDSQIAGLEGYETTSPDEHCHLGHAADEFVINEVKELLCADPNSVLFSQDGFNPENMKTIIPIPQIVTLNTNNTGENSEDSFVDIIDPVSGSSFLCGQTINISVNSDTSINHLVYLIGNASAIISNFDTTITSTSTTINYTLPNDIIGQLEIDVVGLDAYNILAVDSVTFNVITNEILDSIRIEPSQILIPLDNTSSFKIYGYYSDGISRDITRLTGIQITIENENIASINSSGIIEGLSNDSTFMTVSYQGQSQICQIYVYEDNSLSVPLFGSNTDLICDENGYITFYDLSSGKPVGIQWYFPNGYPETSADSVISIYYSSPGTYDVSLIATYSWGQKLLTLEDYITVSVPLYSSLNLLNDTIYCSVTNGSAYQWYHDDDPIYGNNFPYIYPDTIGEYYVDVLNEEGCVARSDSLYYLQTGIKYISHNSQISIYPNPTFGRFTIKTNNNESGEIKVINSLGEVIYQSEILKSKFEVDLSNNPTGIYYVILRTNSNIYSEKIILIK